MVIGPPLFVSIIRMTDVGCICQCALQITFEFDDPFASLYTSGVCSLETAVSMVALTKAPEEEVARIRAAALSST